VIFLYVVYDYKNIITYIQKILLIIIGHKLILEWVNLADLFRVKGIGEEYSDLLEAAGVDTVVELSKRKPENLYKKILEVNSAKKLVRQPPSGGMVGKWIKSAKELPRIVTY